VDIQVGPDGALYYLSIGSGQVRRIAYTGTTTQAIVVSTSELTVTEGASANVNVRLAVDPGTGTTVTVTPTVLNGELTTGAAMNFTGGAGGTWDDYQALAVNALQDDGEFLDEAGAVRLTAAGLPPRTVIVSILDNDRNATWPTAKITLPKHGAVVSGTNAEFFGDGTDDVGTTQAEFFIDGVSVDVDVNASGHYHIHGGHALWDTTMLSNGPHVLRMTVSDGVNVGSHEITVTVSRGGGGGCGFLGVEPLLILGLLRRRRKV
jgi:hypothetical protein